MPPLTASQRGYANELISFIQSSPTPFHAVSTAKKILTKAGFQELPEGEPWADKVQRGEKYFVTRNGSSLIAFGVGGKWEPGKGTAIIGAHTGTLFPFLAELSVDSPVLRLKPVSKRTDDGYMTIGVETYGGGIWHSWFDRYLSPSPNYVDVGTFL
jgi:aspartyl aminopeptidase